MLALLLHIVFASSFTLIIKWAQNRGREDQLTFGAINYIVAAIAILPFFLANKPDQLSMGAIVAGGSMGAIYFIAYFLAIYSIRKVGAASATVVSVLSILLPIAVAAFFYNDAPNGWQVVGIFLALAALTLIGAQTKSGAKQTDDSLGKDADQKVDGKTDDASKTNTLQESQSRKWIIPLALFSFFLLCGFSRIAQEAFKHVVDLEDHSAQRPTFCIAAFTAAAIPSIVMLIFRRKRILPTELGIGVAMGLSNILQTFFILKSLEYFSGFIVFPVGSAGAVVLITIIATGILGERLTRRTVIGIIFSVIALFLLNST